MKLISVFAIGLFVGALAVVFLRPSVASPVDPQASSSLSQSTKAPDRVAADPATAEVLLENDCVRVQYHTVAPGQTIPMHSHPNYVIYVLKPFKARITLPDGSHYIGERKAGEVIWHKAETHSIENIGSGEIKNLVIELKSCPDTSR
jgi:quercetin dioxygenase-like cupin family protein